MAVVGLGAGVALRSTHLGGRVERVGRGGGAWELWRDGGEEGCAGALAGQNGLRLAAGVALARWAARGANGVARGARHVGECAWWVGVGDGTVEGW